MNDPCYCQYAFAQPDCRVEEIGPGVDPRFNVELVCEGPIAAVTSRVGLDQFAPERLQGKTAEDIQWLGKVAARHNEIICQAAAVPRCCRCGWARCFARAIRCRPCWCDADRPSPSSWNNLAIGRSGASSSIWKGRLRTMPRGHAGPPPPHFRRAAADRHGLLDRRRRPNGTAAGNAAPACSRRFRTWSSVWPDKAEHCCRIRNLPSGLTGRSEEMVFNAAFLLSSSAQASWLETVRRVAGTSKARAWCWR